MKRKKIKQDRVAKLPAIVAQRPVRIVSYDPGTSWKIGNDRVTIVAQLTAERLLVRRSADDKTDTVDVSSLAPWIPAPSNDGSMKAAVSLNRHTDKLWNRALEEHRLISALVDNGNVSAAVRRTAARKLEISDRQLRRKIRRFLELKSPEAFIPQRRGPMPGSTYLDPDLEKLVGEEIKRALKNSPDVAVDDLHPLIKSAAQALNLPPPSRDTVSRRLRHERRQIRNLPAYIGQELAYRNSSVRRPIAVDRPPSVVEMDHTVCDVHIRDSKYGLPIGRPVLTMMIDRMTRVILGMLLSLEAPSRLSVGLCMHHGVFHKLPWLTDLGIPDACWPGFGLPTVLYTDNARDFKAHSVRRATEIYSIQHKFRPVGDPAAGGIIERAVGTFMTKVRLLPGTSYSKLLGETPRRADRSARFTLGELLLYIGRQVSIYHKQRHDGIGMPPLAAWEQAWMVNDQPRLPRIPECADKFRLTFLPGVWRTVTREGIELFSLRYQSPDLYPFIERGKRYMVRYDPRDLLEIFLECPAGHLKVPLYGAPMPAFSLWEWRVINAHHIQEGRRRDAEITAAELRANRELIESKAHEKGLWRDARLLARAQDWSRSDFAQNRQDQVVRSLPLDEVPICRVKE